MKTYVTIILAAMLSLPLRAHYGDNSIIWLSSN